MEDVGLVFQYSGYYSMIIQLQTWQEHSVEGNENIVVKCKQIKIGNKHTTDSAYLK